MYFYDKTLSSRNKIELSKMPVSKKLLSSILTNIFSINKEILLYINMYILSMLYMIFTSQLSVFKIVYGQIFQLFTLASCILGIRIAYYCISFSKMVKGSKKQCTIR